LCVAVGVAVGLARSTGVAVATGKGAGAGAGAGAAASVVSAVVALGAAAGRAGAVVAGAVATGRATTLEVPATLSPVLVGGGGGALATDAFADGGLAAITSATGVTSELFVDAGDVLQPATMAPAPKAASTS